MKKCISFILILCMLCAPVSVPAENMCVDTEISSEEDIYEKYGNAYLDITSGEFSSLGFEYADLVKVSFLEQELILPVIPDYRFVGSQCSGLVMWEDAQKRIELSMFNADFSDHYGLSKLKTDENGEVYREVPENVVFPVEVTIELAEKGGYADEYAVYDLERSNERSDYPELTDEQFANFRMVTTSGMGEGKLYRSSSPIDPTYGRNVYADEAAEKAGIRSIVNLADSQESAAAFEGYEDTYYSKQDILFLNLGSDFSSHENQVGIVKAMNFIAQASTPVLVHCQEGQDRAGLISALLECLLGASLDEVRQDYMVSFSNYYGVKEGTDQYDQISGNITKTLRDLFGLHSLEGVDLQQAAEDYLEELGVDAETIEAVRNNLS